MRYCYLTCAFLLMQGCVLVQIQTQNVMISREKVGATSVKTEKYMKWKIRYTGIEDGLARFMIFFAIGSSKTRETKFAIKGESRKVIGRDKNGAFKSKYIGPDWETEGSGLGTYLATLGKSTAMSLGVALVIAVCDWISLPFRLKDTPYTAQETRWNVETTDDQLTRESGQLNIKFGNREYRAIEGVFAVPVEVVRNLRQNYKKGFLTYYIRHNSEERGEKLQQTIREIFGDEGAYKSLILARR